MDENQVRQIVLQTLKGSFDKRIGDTPTDALQLTPKKYVNAQTASVLSVINTAIGNKFASGTDSGSANTYAITPSPALTAYTTGLLAVVKISNSSTGASTLNVSGLGAKSIKKIDGTIAITKGDLVAGCSYTFIYDGTNFVVQVPTQKANGELHPAANAGATTITTNFKPRTIRVNTSYVTATTGAISTLVSAGTWINGVYAEVYSNNTGSSSGGTNISTTSDTANIATGETSGTDGQFTVAVSSVTDTGFDLVLTNATSANPTVRIIWEAES